MIGGKPLPELNPSKWPVFKDGKGAFVGHFNREIIELSKQL